MSERSIAKAKVAGVLSDTELSINKGSNDGLEEGDIAVLNERIEIHDPDTQELLGSVLSPKGHFRLYLVSKKFSIAKVTTRVKSGSDSWGSSVFSALKTLTQDTRSEDDDEIVVSVGDEITIRRNEADDDGAPF